MSGFLTCAAVLYDESVLLNTGCLVKSKFDD